MKNMFKERLEEYRNTLHLNKSEMAHKLNVSEGYYSLIENGKRYPPSKAFLEKLVAYSELPEEHWLYGIDKNEYINTREDFKSLKKALDTILEIGSFASIDDFFDEENNPKDSLGKLLISALKSDISSLIAKRNNLNL
jgi:transcriptional regulator with XRE-family HTH domain